MNDNLIGPIAAGFLVCLIPVAIYNRQKEDSTRKPNDGLRLFQGGSRRNKSRKK